MTDLKRERALIDELYAGDKGLFYWNEEDTRRIAKALAAARREGAEAEREEWMSCALSVGWNQSALDRLWRRALFLTPEEPDGDLNPASCQQGMPCDDTDNCPDPVGCGFEMPPVSEDVMADDVVAELDRWLDRNPMNDRVLTLAALVQRARDEIVELRQAMTHDSAAIATLCNHARAEALEEAAMVADRWEERPEFDRAAAIAAAIRALKDQPKCA